MDSSEIESLAQRSILPIERIAFGGALRRNVRNPSSRFHSLTPRYGIEDSARLITASLWLLPAIPFLIGGICLHRQGPATSWMNVISYSCLGACLLCLGWMLLRGLCVMYRESRSTRADELKS